MGDGAYDFPYCPPSRAAQRREVLSAERRVGPQRRQRLADPRAHPLLPDPLPDPHRPPLRLPRPRLPLHGPPRAPGGPTAPQLPPGFNKHGVYCFLPPSPPPPQVLAGVYPISQLQEPYSAVGFLATRLPLPTLLALRPPSSPAGWTAWDICEGKSASFRVPITPNRGFFCLLYPSRPLHPPLYPFFGGSVGREARLSHGQGGAARRVPGGQQHPAHGGRRASAALPAAPRIQRQRQ